MLLRYIVAFIILGNLGFYLVSNNLYYFVLLGWNLTGIWGVFKGVNKRPYTIYGLVTYNYAIGDLIYVLMCLEVLIVVIHWLDINFQILQLLKNISLNYIEVESY